MLLITEIYVLAFIKGRDQQKNLREKMANANLFKAVM